MSQINPLKQYFRRPALYIKLPSGGNGYPEGTIEQNQTGEFPVFPMTTIDDITTKTPDALMNGHAVCEVIKSCVPNIKNPWNINAVDLDAILVAIKMASSGGNMEIETICPKCKEHTTFELNLSMLLGDITAKPYESPLVIDGLNLWFTPLIYSNMIVASERQFELQRQMQMINNIADIEEKTRQANATVANLANITMQFVALSIKEIILPDGSSVSNSEHINEYLQNIDKTVYEMIKDHSLALRADTQLKPLDLKCPHCEHEYQQALTLNVSDFFA